MGLQGLRHTVEAGLAIGIVLVADRNFLETQRSQLLDHERRLIHIGSAHIEDQLRQLGVAQRQTAGQRCHQRHLGLLQQRNRRHAGGCAQIAKQRQHIVVQEFLGIGNAAVWLIAVIQCAQLHRPLANTALGIELIKVKPGTCRKMRAQLGGRAAERTGLAQHDGAGFLRLTVPTPCRSSQPCCSAHKLSAIEPNLLAMH